MKRLLSRCCLFLLSLAGTYVTNGQLLDPTNLTVPVGNRDMQAVTVAAGDAGALISFTADTSAVGGDMFHAIVDNPAAVVSLILPSSTEVTAANATSLGFTYFTFTADPAQANSLIPAIFNRPGTHTVILTPAAQPAGIYKVKVNAAAAAQPVLAIATYFSSSPVLAGATLNAMTIKTGDPVVITGLLFNGSAAVTGATVTAQIVNNASLGGTPVAVTLLDSGPNDFAVGDGLYTGTAVTGAPGNYTVAVRSTGSAGGATFVRVATTTFKVIPALAAFASFSDAAVDDNSNGKPDRVTVTASLNVQTGGKFQFGVTLLASNGNIAKASGIATLTPGTRTLTASLAAKDIVGLGINGPYAMRDAILILQDGVDNPQVDYRASPGNTAAYALTTLDQGTLFFTGQNAAAGIDTNANGKFETLRVTAGVSVATAGTYQWSGRLVNSAGTEIDFVSGSASFVAGSNNTATFNFSGTKIGQACAAGVFAVRAVLLFGSGSSIVSDELFRTASFNPTQFEGANCSFYVDSIFVQRMYRDFLGRPADAAGLSFWAGVLSTSSRAAVALSFFNSPEFRDTSLYIANAYTAILARDPDYSGFAFWLTQIRNGAPPVNIVNSFIVSPEFQNTYGTLTNAQFINQVYLNVLGRPADVAGSNFWLAQMTAGATRAQIMNSFMVSPEYASSNRGRQLANLAYLGFFARTPEPAGRVFWTNSVNGGLSEADLVTNFITSAEYILRLNTIAGN
ncbi:MAG: DUF4214 domain-containing protein [Bryobacteraceae bacterium]